MLLAFIKKMGASKNNIGKTVETNQKANLQEESISTQNQPCDSLSPWDKYKSNNKEEGESIESISDEKLDLLSSEEVDERVSLFRKMAFKFGCSIGDLKDTCVEKFITQFNENEMPEAIEELRRRAFRESFQNDTAIENTVSYYLHKWLSEYIND